MDVNAWRGKIAPHLNQRARAAFFAYLAYLDAQIGRMVEALGRMSLLNDTFLLFTSDHGEMLGDHNLWRKTYAYEASARVPMIIRPPRSFEAQRNVNIPNVCGWEDVMPTFLDAAGVPIPESVEGRSLMPLIRGAATEWRPYYHHEHAPCYTPETCYQAVNDETWKFIWNPVTGQEQLFNLANDPHECTDLVSSAAHKRELETWRAVLARHLEGRPEGWSDGKTLKTGPYPVWRGA